MTNSSSRIQSVLFDLDGTLADTAPDLAYALNCLLQEERRQALPFEAIRPHVSHGATAMVRLGFNIDIDHPEFEPLRQRFLDLYQANLCRYTTTFPGMDAVLSELERRQLAWGVVTNKPGWLTEPLMDQLGLRQRAACVVSGDTLERKKPHPDPILYACRRTGHQAYECVYVGDAERDIIAGNDAGLHTLVALFGYIHHQENPQRWGADAAIDKPQDIIEWLDRFNIE